MSSKDFGSSHANDETDELFRDDASVGGTHGGTDMGWLVSYADMMTLLVGLFVLLFSLAKQGEGSLETTMKQVSQGYFGAKGTPSATSSFDPAPVSESANELEAEVPSVGTGGSAANAWDNRPEAVETNAAVSMSSGNMDVKEKTAATFGDPPGESKKTKAMMTKLEKSEVEIARLENKVLELEGVKLKAEKSEGELLQKLLSQEAEIAELTLTKKEPRPSLDQRYAVVVVSWETEKHDVDLRITTPSLKTFSFKRREFKSTPGKFEIDSRYGPGIEMWKSEGFEPGIYKVNYSLYSLNGNTKPAEIRFSVVTNSASFKSEPISLTDTGSAKEIKVHLSEDGKIEILP